MASDSDPVGYHPVVPKFDPNGDDEWDQYDMTEEEEELYYKQVRDTEGFDVDEVGKLMFNQIRPVYLLEDNEDTELMVTLAKHAIHEYNNKDNLKAKFGELEYHELLKATQQLQCGFMFRLTFNAKNLAANGEIRTYQAVVLMGVVVKQEVLSFRPMPTGSDNRWYWQGHRCGPEQPGNLY